jgi:hypothetical protein
MEDTNLKTINVTKITHKQLMNLKLDWEFDNMDEVINKLLRDY